MVKGTAKNIVRIQIQDFSRVPRLAMPLTLNPPRKTAVEPVSEALHGAENIDLCRWLEEEIAHE